MRARRGLALLLGLCLTITALPAWGQTAPGPESSRPRLMLSPQRLERLAVLAQGRSPQWRRLSSWALEAARQGADPQDGPGLALAAWLTKEIDPRQAQTLGRLAVACALAGAPMGQSQGASRHLLTDAKGAAGGERLLESGYVLLKPQLDQDQLWRVHRYAPNGVAVDEREPPLPGTLKSGEPYALLLADPLRAARVVGDVALTLDWGREWFSPEQRQAVAAWLVAQARVFSGRPGGCFDRRATATLKLIGLAGMAAQGLHPQAQALMDHARRERWEKELLPCLRGAGQGGAWFEGSHAGAAAGLDLLEYAAALKSVGNEDLTGQASWFADRLAYLAQHTLPGAEHSPRGGYRRLMPDGDQSLPEEEASDLVRLQMMILAALRPQDPAAAWARTLLQDRRTPGVLEGRHLGLEFLWLDPALPSAPWTAIPLTHAATGLGRAFSRSDWSELATWVGLSCGPLFSAGQHLNAGSLLIFKQGMLLGRAGAFDGPTSPHRLNYAMRSLAHNAVIVPDPQEYSWFNLGDGEQKRGHYANDGGQRAPALFDDKGQAVKVAAWTATGWESGDSPWAANQAIYDMGSLEAVEEMPRFSYLRADAAPAYRGSTGKVSRLKRHVFHLRAGGPDDFEAAEAVAVMDDLEVARPELVGRLALHFPSRPEIAGSMAAQGPGRWRGESSRLVVRTEQARLEVAALTPGETQVHLFGEAGAADSWVGERNHPPRPPAVNPMPWRAELVPAKTRGVRQPLVHVLLPAAAGEGPSPGLAPVVTRDPRVVGVTIADNRWPRWVVLRLGQPQAEAVVSYEIKAGDSRHLVAGLNPGTSYAVTVKNGRVAVTPGQGLVASKAGLLAFKLSPTPIAE